MIKMAEAYLVSLPQLGSVKYEANFLILTTLITETISA